MQKILVNGKWTSADSTGTFQAFDPRTGTPIEGDFPVSSWNDCLKMIEAASRAACELEKVTGTQIAHFLRCYADNIEANSEVICKRAEWETGLPFSPRLHDVELPRTTGQLRLAADAAENESWRNSMVDSENKLVSCLGSVGPVVVIGPNNFPLAFNAISGSDFASAIAAGNPVIAKAHPSHPETSRLLAQQARAALETTGLPLETVQMFYQVAPEDGLKLVAHQEVSAIGFTGSRQAGVKLKQVADECGTPIYLEMSSANPVFILPSAFEKQGLVQELAGSCLLGAGQFCTCPNLFVLVDSPESSEFLGEIQAEFESRAPGVLLSKVVQDGLVTAAESLCQAGAEILTGGKAGDEAGFRFENTLMKVGGDQFLANAAELQTEGFGPLSVGVVAKDAVQFRAIANAIEGSLTGCVYSSSTDGELGELSRILRRKVGRLVHNKMPTGVAVSPAMNHGGPFPATGHPGFTAVGMPGSIRRFAKLDCYDNVAEEFWPSCLKRTN